MKPVFEKGYGGDLGVFVSPMDPSTEMEGKKLHDPIIFQETKKTTAATPFNSPVRRMWVPGPVIVGAGPSGLAVAACLKHQPGSLRSLILEKENCVASLWQLKTYDRLRLHLPKQFCELPYLPFPGSFPTYPTRDQFVEYLEDYAAKFDLEVAFNRTVRSAEFDPKCGVWVVRASVAGVSNAAGAAAEEETEEYWCRWVVVATGENAAAVVPEIEGMAGFGGPIVHTCEYRSGEEYRGKRVLVVGCGNSGMEISLDLCHFSASPFLVVRDSVHVLPQEMVGRSTFAVAMWMLKWLPVGVVDLVLLAVSHLMLGDTGRLGLHRPKLGPLQLKNASGKTPVLDVGTLAMINSGHIQVRPGIKRLTCRRAEFTDGRVENFDAIVLATGYKSNVQSWLKESEMFSKEDGLPRKPFPNGWKGEHGLYAVGFTNRGLLGASMDARRIAEDIAQSLKLEPTLYFMPLPCTQPSHSIL